jgi:hypothetical protein
MKGETLADNRGGWCLLVAGLSGLFLAVIQGLLYIASGLTLPSTEYRWAAVCLESVRRKIPLRKKTSPAKHQPGALIHLSADHARGEQPPKVS